MAGLDTGMLDDAAAADVTERDGHLPDAAVATDLAERDGGPPDAALPPDLAGRDVGPPDAALPPDLAARDVGPPDAALPPDLAERDVGPPDAAALVDVAAPADRGCAGPLECPSGVCTQGVCQAPRCSDNVKNGTETDIDCGGACPNKCGTGKTCTIASNCTSNICTAGICQGTPVTVELAIAASADDAEESLTTGSVVLDSSDLELDFDAAAGAGRQVVGIRFVKVPLPRAASIITAYVQFTAKDASSKAASVTIKGQAADNAPVFTTATGSITARPTTTASVAWTSIPNWTADSAGPATRTPELKPIIEELIQRPGWAPANALVFLLGGNGGDRNPYAFDGRALSAPRLHIEYLP